MFIAGYALLLSNLTLMVMLGVMLLTSIDEASGDGLDVATIFRVAGRR